MALFAQPDDLAARLGLDLTDAETERAITLLETASGIVQDATGQDIAAVADDELVRPSTYDSRFRLPERPVTSVTSVTLDTTELVEGTDWYLDGDEVVRCSGAASEFWWTGFRCHGRGFLGPRHTLTVVYAHGWGLEDIPPIVRATCVEAVARVWTNPGNVIQETYGSEQVMYAQQGSPGLLLTDAERKRVCDIVRRTQGSVPLR